jgi:hypothetical protein
MISGRRTAQGASFDLMMVPETANMPPSPWQIDLDVRDLGRGKYRASGARCDR